MQQIYFDIRKNGLTYNMGSLILFRYMSNQVVQYENLAEHLYIKGSC
jgi:hypothetical protein